MKQNEATKKTSIIITAFKPSTLSSYQKTLVTNFPNSLKVVSKSRFSPLQCIELIRKMWKRDEKQIVILWDAPLFSDLFSLPFFILFLLFCKMQRKKISIISHTTISHIVSSNIYFPHQIYSLLLFCMDKLIVCEEIIKDRLFVHDEKIVVIPHAVENTRIKTKPRKDNSFRILIVAPKKRFLNSEWLVHQFKILREKSPRPIVILEVRQGGPIGSAVATADLVIFPSSLYYPFDLLLAKTLEYEKPFLLSAPLSHILKTHDMKKTLRRMRMSEDMLVFRLSDDFYKKVLLLIKNPLLLRRLGVFSKAIKEERSWKNTLNRYAQELSL